MITISWSTGARWASRYNISYIDIALSFISVVSTHLDP